MRRILLIFILSTSSVHAYCQHEFPHAFTFGPDNRINLPTGDTINRWDANEYFHGFHIWIIGWSNVASDTNEWTCGYFTHGQPTGEWIHHFRDGSYGLGSYLGLTGEIVLGGTTGNWSVPNQGLNCKIGIWKYYDRDSSLIRTMNYTYTFDRHGTTYLTQLMDSTGIFRTMRYQFANRFNEESRFSKVVDNEYTISGLPVNSITTQKRKTVSRFYEYDGIIYEKVIAKDKKYNECVSIFITYNRRGKHSGRTRERTVKPPHLTY